MLSTHQDGVSALRAESNMAMGPPPPGLPPPRSMPVAYQVGAVDDESGIAPLLTSRQRRAMTSPRSQPPAFHLPATPAPHLLPPEPDAARSQQVDDSVRGAGRASSDNHPAHMLHPDRQASISAGATLESAGHPSLRATPVHPGTRVLRSDRQVSTSGIWGSISDPLDPALARAHQAVNLARSYSDPVDPALARAQQAVNLARSVVQTPPENPPARTLRSDRPTPAAAILDIASGLPSLAQPRPLVAESLARPAC